MHLPSVGRHGWHVRMARHVRGVLAVAHILRMFAHTSTRIVRAAATGCQCGCAQRPGATEVYCSDCPPALHVALQFSLNGGLQSCHEAAAAIATPHPDVPLSSSSSNGADVDAAPQHSSSLSSAGAHVNADADASSSGAVPEGPAVLQPPQCGIEGVMIGRAAYNDPWGCLGDADRAVFGAASNAAPSRRWVLEQYRQYAEAVLGRWVEVHAERVRCCCRCNECTQCSTRARPELRPCMAAACQAACPYALLANFACWRRHADVAPAPTGVLVCRCPAPLACR